MYMVVQILAVQILLSLSHHAGFEELVGLQQFIPCEANDVGFACVGFCQNGRRCMPGPSGCTCSKWKTAWLIAETCTWGSKLKRAQMSTIITKDIPCAVYEDDKAEMEQLYMPCEASVGFACAGFCQNGQKCRPGPSGCTCSSKPLYPRLQYISPLLSRFSAWRSSETATGHSTRTMWGFCRL